MRHWDCFLKEALEMRHKACDKVSTIFVSSLTIDNTITTICIRSPGLKKEWWLSFRYLWMFGPYTYSTPTHIIVAKALLDYIVSASICSFCFNHWETHWLTTLKMIYIKSYAIIFIRSIKAIFLLLMKSYINYFNSKPMVKKELPL